MPAPKKFPTHIGTNATYLFMPWTPEPVRYWMTLTQPESAQSSPPPILKIVLEDILSKNGLNIVELKKNLRKSTDVKCLTGVYYTAASTSTRTGPATTRTRRPSRTSSTSPSRARTGKQSSRTQSHTITPCTKNAARSRCPSARGLVLQRD